MIDFIFIDCLKSRFRRENVNILKYLRDVIVAVMRGSRNCRQGVQVNLTKISSDNVVLFFLVLSLFYISQMVNFKENYHFSRFQRGSNIFQGGGGGVHFFYGGPIAYFL